mmetsp:Transcript_40251/g.66070  ORF Transcript_40251/g.66070 Transcript_40251/m.66070 type:complete len:677 (+) Transcript_40251:129-2159(+)
MSRAFDLSSVEPSEFMDFRNSWMKDSGLEAIGAERLFEHAGLTELVELDLSELKEYSQEIGLNVIERRRLTKAISKLNGAATPATPFSPSSAVVETVDSPHSEATVVTKHGDDDDETELVSFASATPTGGAPRSTNPTFVPAPIQVQHAKQRRNTCDDASELFSPGSVTPCQVATPDKFVFPRPSKKTKKSRHSSCKSTSNLLSSKKSAHAKMNRSNRSKSNRGLRSPSTPSRVGRKTPTSVVHTPSKNEGDVDGPMYDPTGKSSAPATPNNMENYGSGTWYERCNREKDLGQRISDAIEKLHSHAEATKQQIRRTFMEFGQRLRERESRLLKDVEATADKKSRLLQTQLEYIKETAPPGSSELACDPNMSLLIEKDSVLTTLMTAGWVQGASSDNKAEQAMQDRERRRREYLRQQYLTVESLKNIFIHEKECRLKREDSVRLTSEIQDEIALINVRTSKCEAELAEAHPLIEHAKKLVSKINKKQLDEIRVLKKPPAVVELVMSAVAVILGNKVKSWKDIQKCLSKATFIPSMLNFNTMDLKKKVREEVVKYVNHEDFNEERANKASKVAGPLVKWVKSQVQYSELLDVVRPMQKEIKILKRKLDKKQTQYQMCIDVVNELEVKISTSRTDMNEMVENMIKCQDECGFTCDATEQSNGAMALQAKLMFLHQSDAK